MTLSIRPLRSHLSLRSLRTAFSHAAASPSTSPTMSEAEHTLSPSAMHSHPVALPQQRHDDAEPRLSTQSYASTAGFDHPSDAPRRVIRTKKSMLELEQEDERLHIDNALVALVEPRPSSLMPTLGGIEEMIEGRI